MQNCIYLLQLSWELPPQKAPTRDHLEMVQMAGQGMSTITNNWGAHSEVSANNMFSRSGGSLICHPGNMTQEICIVDVDAKHPQMDCESVVQLCTKSHDFIVQRSEYLELGQLNGYLRNYYDHLMHDVQES